jgi:vacuolar-type H+-ATPase subunit D/Vma8
MLNFDEIDGQFRILFEEIEILKRQVAELEKIVLGDVEEAEQWGDREL